MIRKVRKSIVPIGEKGQRLGEFHPKAKYSDREISILFNLRDRGFGYKKLSAILGMPIGTVKSICRGAARNQTPADYREIDDEH